MLMLYNLSVSPGTKESAIEQDAHTATFVPHVSSLARHLGVLPLRRGQITE